MFFIDLLEFLFLVYIWHTTPLKYFRSLVETMPLDAAVVIKAKDAAIRF